MQSSVGDQQQSSGPLGCAEALEALIVDDQVPAMMPLARRLWPICRSITGPGVRETLDIIGEKIDLTRLQTASGEKVHDWTVPPEWIIRDAFIANEDGERIVDFANNNLHVVGYSTPVDEHLTRDELDQYLHSIPEQPDAIPYVTSYYQKRWGFCISQNQRAALPSGLYHCKIDSELREDGCLDFAESTSAGEQKAEVFFSTYVCHPSLANNELSGPLVATTLFSILKGMSYKRLSYRLALTTETIGTLCYLKLRGKELLSRMRSGYVITSVGDDGPFTYQKPRNNDPATCKVTAHALRFMELDRTVRTHEYRSESEERQYCSPGYDLPVVRFSRTNFDEYPSYHTSLDNLDFISEHGLRRSLIAVLRICQTHELDMVLVRTNPFGEPQLGKRGLYHSGRAGIDEFTTKMLAMLSYCDGKHSLVDIADKHAWPVWTLIPVVKAAFQHELIRLA